MRSHWKNWGEDHGVSHVSQQHAVVHVSRLHGGASSQHQGADQQEDLRSGNKLYNKRIILDLLLDDSPDTSSYMQYMS